MSEGDNRNRLTAVLKDELDAYCQSDSLSEIGLHEIIARHGLEPNNNHCGDFHFFLLACWNQNITEEIIQCLLEYFPHAANIIYDADGNVSLHYACYNKNVTPKIVELLIDAAPNSVRCVTNEGSMPLHILCDNSKVDEGTAMQILKLLIEKYPEAVRHTDNDGDLPIHLASKRRSLEFCRVLIEAYPGSERISNAEGQLPLHYACVANNVATVAFLLQTYQDAINHADVGGFYPIMYAISSTEHRDDPASAVEIVQFLLDCDPNQKLIQLEGSSLLHFACTMEYNESNIEAGIQMIKVIFDAHPEAIEDDRIMADIRRSLQQVRAFINSQLVYVRLAKDQHLRRRLETPNDNGQLPLHVALRNNARLGAIKLLVKGNPAAVQSADNSGALPLHSAYQHHDSASVVRYLVEHDPSTLDSVDKDGNTAFHLACRYAKYETIMLLLEKYDGVSVSKRNAHGELPINLLWKSNAVEDRESVEYTESVFRLLKAYPETVTNNNVDDITQQTELGVYSSQNAKKRKRDIL